MIIPVVNQKSDVPGAGPHYSVSCKRVGRLRYKCTSFFMRYINLVRLFNLRIPIFSSKHKDGCMYFWELWRKLTEVKFKTHNEKEQSKSPPVPSSWEMGESLNTSGSTCVFFLFYFCQSVCLSLYISIINLLTQHKQNFTYVWTFFFLHKSCNSCLTSLGLGRTISQIQLGSPGLQRFSLKVRQGQAHH